MSLSEKEVQKRIEDLPLPQSIKRALEGELKGIEVSEEEFGEVAGLVVADYERSRVEPCEAVGVVAA